MNRQCPQCQASLSSFAVSCEKCGWALAGLPENRQPFPTPPPNDFENCIARSLELIEQESFGDALMCLNRAIIDAPPERLAECYSLRGYVHLKNLDWGRSEDDCTEAIELNWNEAQTYAWRAAARGEQNKWRLAFDDLDRACELAAPYRDPYLSLMESYSNTASDYFRELIKAGEDSADMFFERGWIYFRSGKYKKAERDFQHALKRVPHHPWASIGMAELLLRQGATDSVLELCKDGLYGDLECQRYALRIRARLNRQLGEMTRAKRDLDRLARLAEGDLAKQVACARLRSELGDPVGAIDQLTEVITTAPDYHVAILVRGDCFSEIRNYPLALQDYTGYLKAYPRHVNALVSRAKAWLATRNFDRALADLNRVLAIEETHFEAYLVRAKVFLAQEALGPALTDCQRAVQLNNGVPEAFSVLSSIHHQLGDYGNAIEQLARSIELAPTANEKAQYLYLRGIEYYELGDFEKGLADFSRSSKLRPNFAGSWIWKAAACSRLEKWTDAILGLQQAMLVRPSASKEYQELGRPIAEKAIAFFNRQQQRGYTKTDLFRKRGLACQFVGRNEEAIEDYTLALSEAPDHTETLIRRGQVFTQSQEYDRAIADFTRVIRADKKNHRARYCRAIARLAQKDFEAAEKDLLKAINIAPQHPRYHILLGELLQKTGDRQGVVEAFDRAVLQDPSNPVTYRRRADAHLQAGRYLNAISDFTHSLELHPSQFDLLVQRGQTYLKINQPVMALEDFELALTHDNQLAKAYSGRATILASQGRYEYGLIWLTKAIHRFNKPRELAEIVFARGKVFFQMGRHLPAIADFTLVMELMRHHRKTVAAARYARAIAEIHAEHFDLAQRDFQKLTQGDPDNPHFQQAIQWLQNRDLPLPAFLQGPQETKRPTRPAIMRNGVELSESTLSKWEAAPPHNLWIVRNTEKKEYGPVPLAVLKAWAAEGRLDIGMKLLRADWSKWKRVEKIFSEISPLERAAGMIEEFPELAIPKSYRKASSQPEKISQDQDSE